MAKRSILDAQEEATEINLSPMIDCIFILLIFFIVTTVFVEEQGLAVQKPDAAAPASLEDEERVVFEITAEGRVLFGDGEVGMGEIPGLVKTGLSGGTGTGGSGTPVVIRAHEKSDHGVFVAVWDAARRGGAEMLTFSTVD